jgi:hypothetical protein
MLIDILSGLKAEDSLPGRREWRLPWGGFLLLTAFRLGNRRCFRFKPITFSVRDN